MVNGIKNRNTVEVGDMIVSGHVAGTIEEIRVHVPIEHGGASAGATTGAAGWVQVAAPGRRTIGRPDPLQITAPIEGQERRRVRRRGFR